MEQDPEFIPARFYETPEALVLTDRDGRILWVNPGFTIMCGYELFELKGRKPGSVLQGPDTDPKVVEGVRQALKAGIGCEVELTNYHKDGHSYAVFIQIRPIHNDHGRVTYFAAIERKFTDEEKQQLGEQTLRNALHSILQDFVSHLRGDRP